MGTWKIRESGKNGTVQVMPDRLVRTLKKRIGKDDVQLIPIKHITSVHHDRKSLSTDKVLVQAGVTTYEWKVSKAESFVRAVNEAVFSA